MAINSKAKGNKNERSLAAYLRNVGIDKDAGRNVSSGSGIYKSDLHNSLGLNIETKHYASLGKTSAAMKQADRDAQMSGTLPILFLRENGMPEDTWLVVMYNDMWVDLWKRSREPKNIDSDTQDFKWAVKALLQAAKKVIKYLEK